MKIFSGMTQLRIEEFSFTPRYICYCGTHGAENAAAAQQSNFTSTMLSQAGQVFGADSSVFNTMKNSYNSTVNAGPSQQGFSAAQQSAMNAQAITTGATETRGI